MHYGDMTDSTNLIRLMQQIRPTEIYNLAAQSHVGVSFESPEYTANADAIGVLRLLEAIRILGMEKETRLYQASTSELYGLVQEVPQKETTPFYPRSPYGVAKLYGYWITVNYREAYGIYASNGILFNHESPIRGETFVTRKITRSVARIETGQEEVLDLGNLEAKRDWGHARDYVEGMHKILQADVPDDFVLATGETRSVRKFVELAFVEVGRSIEWRGRGVDETGVDRKSGKTILRIDPVYFRPTEVGADQRALCDCEDRRDQDGGGLSQPIRRRFHQCNADQSVRKRRQLSSRIQPCRRIHLIKTYSGYELVNIGTGEDITIAEFARMVAATVGYSGAISFDPSRPDGTSRKLLDVSRLAKLGWRASTSLEDGIRLAYQAYLDETRGR